MAFQFMKLIHILKKEREAWKDNDAQLRHILLHEEAHREQGFMMIIRSRKDEEIRAEVKALKIIMKEYSLSIDEAILLEADYRIWKKYGIKISELKKHLIEVSHNAQRVKQQG